MAQSEFQLQVTNTPADFHRFQTFYCSKQLKVWARTLSMIGYQLVLAAIFVPAGFWLFTRLGREVNAPFLDFKLIGCVVGALLALTIYFKTANRVLAPFFKVDLGNFTTPTRYSVSEAGVRTESENGEGLLRWRAIRDVVPSAEAIYLAIGGATALVIPTRFFSSTEEVASFVEFARQQVAAARPPAKT